MHVPAHLHQRLEHQSATVASVRFLLDGVVEWLKTEEAREFLQFREWCFRQILISQQKEVIEVGPVLVNDLDRPSPLHCSFLQGPPFLTMMGPPLPENALNYGVAREVE